VGIRDPRGEPEDLIASIDLGGAGSDEAISTSGDYERYFVRDGVRYHHLLDPRTGMPAEGSMSVTVVAPKAVLTDGYATGVFVLGPEKGIALLERLGLGGVIITADGRRLVTRNLESRVDWIDRAGE
jgi:thiamine biosynthesis lipoprotein